MNERTFRAQDEGGPPADPLDAFFDGELDEAGARRLFSALRADVRAAEDFVQTQRVVAAVREPVEGPDVSDAVLERLERSGVVRSRPRWRWLGGGGRLAASVGLIMGVGAIVLLDRLTPAPVTVVRAPTSNIDENPPALEAPVGAPAALGAALAQARAREHRLTSLRPDVRPLTPRSRSAEPRPLTYSGGAGDLWLSTSGREWERGVGRDWLRQPGDALLSIPALPAGFDLIRLPERP
jgi:hypothetical protein